LKFVFKMKLQKNHSQFVPKNCPIIFCPIINVLSIRSSLQKKKQINRVKTAEVIKIECGGKSYGPQNNQT